VQWRHQTAFDDLAVVELVFVTGSHRLLGAAPNVCRTREEGVDRRKCCCCRRRRNRFPIACWRRSSAGSRQTVLRGSRQRRWIHWVVELQYSTTADDTSQRQRTLGDCRLNRADETPAASHAMGARKRLHRCRGREANDALRTKRKKLYLKFGTNTRARARTHTVTYIQSSCLINR
jgi:hypothetical protein